MYSILVSLWSLCTQALQRVPGTWGKTGVYRWCHHPHLLVQISAVELSFGECCVPRLYYDRCVSSRCAAHHLTTNDLIRSFTSFWSRRTSFTTCRVRSLMPPEVLPLTKKTSFITFSGPPLHVKCSRLYFTYMEIYIHIEFLLSILRSHLC